MQTASSRPILRAVESIVVPDAQHGQVLVLRDTQGVTDGHAVIPPPLVPIVARFTGEHTCEEIARDASIELSSSVPVTLVVQVASELDRGLFLRGSRYVEARARVESEFAHAHSRAAIHAGGAYYADPAKLSGYLEDQCLGRADIFEREEDGRNLVGLIAPHIDPFRGAESYGHAYGALAHSLPPEADTFILLGTSHAPMREPFALCRKAFETPLGPLEADLELIDAIASQATFDPFADQFNHRREHSLEFQVVFLKHLLGSRPAKIVPVLAGLGHCQADGTDPEENMEVAMFLDSIRNLITERRQRVILIAGADLAHVGPRFGDKRACTSTERSTLEETDRLSLAWALEMDPLGFWKDVAKDLDTRRVCGLAPIYSLLRLLPSGTNATLLHYEQTIDEDDGSIVSHAAAAFYA